MRATVAKTKYLMKRVRKVIKTKQTPRTVDAYIHRCSNDTLDSMLFMVEREDVNVRTHAVDNGRIKALSFPSYYRKTIHFYKYDHVTFFLSSVLIPYNLRLHMFFLAKSCFTLKYGAEGTQRHATNSNRDVDREDDVNQLWMYGRTVPNQCIVDRYLMTTSTELMGTA